MPEKTSTQSKSKWNIMVYIVGDGSLSASMISQLKELTDAGFQKDTTVLAFFDPNSNGKKAKIFDVNGKRKQERRENEESQTIIGDGRDPYVRDISDDFHVPSLPDLQSSVRLRYFLEYSRAYYPAENYMLFLMGHGVVVGNDTFLPDPDDVTGGITLSDLGWILANFGEQVRADKSVFQLVGFHSCSMNSVELIHDLAGSANYMMGAQGSVTPGSWPYRQILKRIFGVIEESRNRDASTLFMDTILPSLQSLSFYNSEDFWLAGYSADLSICSLDPKSVNKLKLRLTQLSRALKAGLKDRATKDCIQLAHLKSQSYWAENYSDVYDFCLCLSEQCREGNGLQFAIKSACGDVMSALNGRSGSHTSNGSNGSNGSNRSTSPNGPLVLYSDYYGPAYQFSNGLSIYFPWRRPDSTMARIYTDYNFTKEYKEDSWWSFLEEYFVATLREPRNKDGRIVRESHATTFAKSQGILDLKKLTTAEVLSLGQAPFNQFEASYGAFEPSVKLPGTLEPPDKPSVTLEPPDKPSVTLEPPDKPSVTLEPPDKPSVMLEPPDKPSVMLEPPDKPSVTLEPPDKPSVTLEPPDKIPGLGMHGFSVIKNFYSPDDLITSRSQKFPDWKCHQPQGVSRGANNKRP